MKIGDKYNYWTVLELLEKSTGRFQCCCGAIRIKPRTLVKNNYTRSCGCQSKKLRKATNLERYGNEFSSSTQRVKDKIKETFIEKYGVDNPRKAPEVIAKIVDKKKKKYGEHFEKIFEKQRENCLVEHGVEYHSQRPEIRTKTLATMQDRFNGNAPLASNEIQEKVRETCLERYGVDNPLKLAEFQDKARATLLERHGVTNPGQSAELRKGWTPTLADGTLASEFYQRYKVPASTASRVLREFGEEVFRDFCVNYKQENVSSLETRMLKLLRQIDPELSKYDRAPVEDMIQRCRPDFRITKGRRVLYINVDGLYYHSELRIDKDYHYKLRASFQGANVRLMQFREDEVRDKPEIVMSIVKNYLGLSEKIGARKCKIEIVSQKNASRFYEENHLMGRYEAAKNYGLFYEGELVQLMSIRQTNRSLEMARLCTTRGLNIQGGLSKLLKYVKLLYDPDVITSFCDLRYSDGKGYSANGFKRLGCTLGFDWTDMRVRYNRRKCRANMDGRKLTQAEAARELKWYRIYDAGQAKYELRIS